MWFFLYKYSAIESVAANKVPAYERTAKANTWYRYQISRSRCGNQVFGRLSYNRETYDYRQREIPETGGATVLMATYTESGPKTYVGRFGELVNSISPQISAGPQRDLLLPPLLPRFLLPFSASLPSRFPHLFISTESGNSPTFVLCSVALPLVASAFTAPPLFIPALG